MDVTAMNIDRFHKYQANPRYRQDRVIESLGNVYKCHYPAKPTKTARGIKRSPLHSALAAKNASFRDVSGWEAPDWYALNGGSTEVGPLTWGKHHWFPNWAAEHNACREGVALFDMRYGASTYAVRNAQCTMLNQLHSINSSTRSSTHSSTHPITHPHNHSINPSF